MPIPAARTTIRALSSHAALPFRRALLQDEIRGMAGGPIELPAEPPSMNTDYRFGAEAARAGTQKPRNYTTVSSPAYRPPPPQYSDVPTSEQHPCPAAYTPPARVFTPSGTHTSPSSALPAYASTYTPPAPPTYAPPVPPVPPTAAPARVDLALHADVAALKTTMAALLAAPRRAETPECVRRLQTKLDVLEARLAARTPRTALPTYAPEPPRPPPTPAPATEFSGFEGDSDGLALKWRLLLIVALLGSVAGVGTEAVRRKEAAQKATKEKQATGGRRWFGYGK